MIGAVIFYGFVACVIVMFVWGQISARRLPWKSERDALAEQRASRARYVALEHEAMAHWETLCNCPPPLPSPTYYAWLEGVYAADGRDTRPHA